MKKLFFFFQLSIVNLAFCQSVVKAQSPGQVFYLDKNTSVAILPIGLRYLDQSTDALLVPEHFGGLVAAQFFCQELEEILLAKTISACPVDTASNTWQDLQIARNGLFKSTIKPGLLSGLKEMGQRGNCRYLLVTELRVKVGEDAEWIPLTIVFYGKTHNTRIKAILLDTETGAVHWKNEMEFKELPDPRSKKFLQAIQLTFSTLKTK